MAPHSINIELTSDECGDHVCITHINPTKRQTMSFFLCDLICNKESYTYII